MVGVSLAKLWSIDRTSGAATEISDFDGSTDGLTSLAFVPLDDADPGERRAPDRDRRIGKRLRGATRSPGATSLLGNLGLSSGSQIRAGGDLVSVRGLGTFATVAVGNTATDPDCLATIDTTTWAATLVGATSTGFDKVRRPRLLGRQGARLRRRRLRRGNRPDHRHRHRDGRRYAHRDDLPALVRSRRGHGRPGRALEPARSTCSRDPPRRARQVPAQGTAIPRLGRTLTCAAHVPMLNTCPS